MDIELPNGTVIEGIPEGTNKWKVMEVAIAKGLATPEDFGQQSTDPTEGTSARQRFREGIGRGMVRTAKSVGNILGLVEDDTINEMDRLDKPLTDTRAGAAGQFTGEVAMTLPAGGPLSGGLRAAAARLGARGLTRTGAVLAGRVAPAAIEGASIGGVLAKPGERLEGMTMGAGMGGAMGYAGKLLGGAIRAVTPRITDEAARLQKMTGTFVPLSQALRPGIGRQFYEAFLANLPGVGGRIRGQYKNALEDLRRFAGEQAHPPRANIVIRETDTIRDVFGKLENYWKTAYDEIGKLPIKLFSGAGGRAAWTVPQEVTEAMGRASGGRFVPPSAGQTVTGEVMLNLRRATDELLENINPDSVLKGAQRAELEAFRAQIDDLLKQNLNPTGKGKGRVAEIYNDYVEKAPYYQAYQDLLAAGQKAIANAEFSPSQLAEAAGRRAGVPGLKGGASDSLQEVGRLAKSVLPDFPSRQGLFQTAAALGLGGSLLTGAGVPAAGGAAGMVALGRLLASQRAQKLISGQYDLLNKYSRGLRRMGRAGRYLTTVGVSDASGS